MAIRSNAYAEGWTGFGNKQKSKNKNNKYATWNRKSGGLNAGVKPSGGASRAGVSRAGGIVGSATPKSWGKA